MERTQTLNSYLGQALLNRVPSRLSLLGESKPPATQGTSGQVAGRSGNSTGQAGEGIFPLWTIFWGCAVVNFRASLSLHGMMQAFAAF